MIFLSLQDLFIFILLNSSSSSKGSGRTLVIEAQIEKKNVFNNEEYLPLKKYYEKISFDMQFKLKSILMVFLL